MNRALIAVLCLAPAALADDVPRYKFTPGLEIAYRYESSFKYGQGENAGELRNRQEWTGWVLRANPDGSARLLIRDVGHMVQVRGGKAGAEQSLPQLVYADVFPDGRIPPNPTIRYRGEPSRFFPRLPKDAAEAKAGWERGDADAKTVATPTDGGRFAVATTDAHTKVYLTTSKSTYRFDPARGLIARADVERAQGYGFEGKGTGTIELVGEKTLAPADLAALAADSDRCFAAIESHDDALEAAAKFPPDRAKEAFAKALDALKASADEVGHPDLKAALADQVKRHKDLAEYALDCATQRAKVVGKPAFAADATDLDGKPVELASLKGQVVVLDFWYRGCGWCIKAMPQVNQLAADFAGQKVAVLGFNTDEKQEDAEFVIKQMGLKYPTWRVEQAASEKFGVRTFPTLVLIDKKGVVRDLHVGYSATLREDIGKAVRALLAEE